MCDADTIEVVAVYARGVKIIERIRRLLLIPNDSTADVTVLDSVRWKYCRVTASSIRSSSTRPPWCCDEPPCTWALLRSVGCVEVCNACPSSCAVTTAATRPVHVAIDLHSTPIGTADPIVSRGAACGDCTAGGCGAGLCSSKLADDGIAS